MTARANETAGIGDPYWYEWSVGLLRVLDMLDPTNGIKSVTLQADELQGLDDVVVDFKDGRRRCVQVKHTREVASITFGDLVSDGLLSALAIPWQQARLAGHPCTAELYTNRAVGRRIWTPRDGGAARPPLAEFWPYLKREAQTRSALDEIQMPPEWAGAWAEWQSALTPLTMVEQFEFIRALDIAWDSPGLEQTEAEIKRRLQSLFLCSDAQATELLAALDTALRKWTTTARSASAISEEDVYSALGLPTENDVSNHLIAPPEPFFPSRLGFCTELIAALQATDTRMVFLVGDPGSGKTSIVSSLANRRTPAIDARYHAYRPITPDTQHLPPDADVDVSQAGLWGSLLSQLRQQLHGRLAEKRVPIRNRFLSPDRMRQEVLRIANEVGRERGHPFVIAVDGIDHAARSSEPKARALLASLPEPEHLPEHVRVLIAGQPPEAWPQYPDWLRDPNGTSLRHNAPRIGDEDVATLVAARCPAALGSLDVVTRLVSDASNGDTLAAVFAVEESRLAQSLDAFRDRLAARGLHSGVRAYYAQIWDSVATRLGTERPFDALRLGTVLALFDQRVTPTMLGKLFADRQVPIDDWQEALLSLRPLVVEEGGAYRLTHNDVRVFLAAKLRAEPERTRLIASRLADFCRCDPDAGDSRYTLTFDMLTAAGRAPEIPVVFDTEFVVSGWRRGIAFKLLEQHGARATWVLVESPPNWETLQRLICALLTVEQLDRSTDRLEFPRDRVSAASPRMVPALISECRVAGTGSWTEEQVRHALRDAEQLLVAGELDRGRGLLRRWFRAVSPPQLKKYVQAATQFSTDETGDSVLGLYGGTLWRAFGRDVFCSTPIEKDTARSWARFYGGYLDPVLESKTLPWARAFISMRMLDIGAIEAHVTETATTQRWAATALALRHLTDHRDAFSDLFVFEAAAWALLIGLEDLVEAWVEPLEKDIFDIVRASDSQNRASVTVSAAFVQGWRTRRPLEAIREDALSAYTHQHVGRKEASAQLTLFCFAAAVTGRWLNTGDPPLTVARTRELFSRLLEHVRPLDLYRESPRLSPLLVRLLVEAASRGSVEHRDALTSECEDFAKGGRHGPAMPIVWAVLAERGEIELLSEWTQKRFGPSGLGWRLDTAGRVAELETLARLCTRVPALQRRAEELKNLARAAALGYVSEDEYVLTHPLRWFRKLAASDPAIWESYGKKLLAVSFEAEFASDNRVSPNIDEALASAAARCGANAIARLHRAKMADAPLFDPSSPQWLDGIVQALDTMSLDAETVSALWVLFLSQLSWREDQDIGHLYDASTALARYFAKGGHARELARIQDASRVEWTMAQRAARKSNERIPGDVETKLVAEFGERSIADAIRHLVANTSQRSRLSDVLRASETIAKRIVDERPPEAAELAWALFSALTEHREIPASPWRFEGLEKCIHLLGPMLTEAHQWEVVRSIVNRLHEREGTSVTSLVDELDGWSLAIASEARIGRGLEEHLRTQASWLPPGRALRQPDLDAALEPGTWQDFAVDCILETLGSDSGVLNQAAMRAMLVLSRLLPSAFDSFLQKATKLSRPDREAIAQFAEHVAATAPAEFVHFEPFLKHCEQSSCFELELQAWIARCTFARTTGARSPKFVLSPLATRPPVIVAPTRVVVAARENKAAGQSTMGMQAVASIVRQLEHAIDASAAKIEAALFASIEKEPLRRMQRPHRSRPGDNQFFSTEEVERLYDVLRSGFDGVQDSTLAVRLAQALLIQDEPSIMFGDLLVRLDAFPTDDELRDLLARGQPHLRQRLWDVLTMSLGDDERVFAGALYICGYRIEISFSLLPWFRDDPHNVGARKNPTTFGGRMYAYTHDLRFDARDEDEPPCWLALLGRGLSRAPHQNVGVVPSTRLQLEGGWTYPGGARGMFTAGDGSQVRYERVLGAPRREPREHRFRDPYFERWVCKRTMIEDLERRLRGSISMVPDLEMYKQEED